MNLQLDNLSNESFVGEGNASPSMLSQQEIDRISIEMTQLEMTIDYLQHYLERAKHHEMIPSIVSEPRFKSILKQSIGCEEIAVESFRETILTIWKNARAKYAKVREEIVDYYIKVMTDLGAVQTDWKKTYAQFLKDKNAGNFTEVSNTDLNKAWFQAALSKGKLTYLNFNKNGVLNIKEHPYKVLTLDMSKFIKQSFNLITQAVRRNNSGSIANSLSNAVNELFILFDKKEYRKKNYMDEYVYEIARFGWNSLIVPVIPRSEESRLDFIQKVKPIQNHFDVQYLEGQTIVPVATIEQVELINLAMKQLDEVARFAKANSKLYSKQLSNEDKLFTNMILAAQDDELQTVAELQQVIGFVNSMANIELEYLRLLTRSAMDLNYFAKCITLVMKDYHQSFTE